MAAYLLDLGGGFAFGDAVVLWGRHGGAAGVRWARVPGEGRGGGGGIAARFI